MLSTRFTTAVLLLTVGSVAFATLRPSFFAQEPPQATEEHKEIMKGVGEWEGTLTMSMPGAPAEPIKATETVTAIGEFWTQGKFQCDFMGQPFMGSGTTGYDPAKKKFVGTWIDSMTTEMFIMEGTMDPKTKVLTMNWEAPSMATGERVPHRMETVFKGDSYTSTFFQGEDKGEQTMVIAMKRKAKQEIKK